MEGTDINFPDPDGLTNDHTYYGNGCPNGWRDNDPPLYGGSTISCSTNIVNTYDNKESQKIGAYYNFQAGTVGAGASITTENTNTLDTFCPLGWQMPYGGTGGDYYDQPKSFRYLTSIYGLITNSDGYKLALYPFDYIKSGYMNIGTQNTRLYSITKFGAFNTRTNRTPTTYFTFSMNDIYITLDSQNGKNSGHAIRCVNNFSIPPSTARWRELLRI